MADSRESSGIVNPLLPRRGFLLGLGAVLAAPAVVRASGLMQVRSVDHLVYSTRGLMDYCIGTDQLVVRIDQANFELAHLKHMRSTIRVLSPAQVRRALGLLSQETRDALRPQPRAHGWQQKHIDFAYTPQLWAKLGLGAGA